MVVMAIGEDSQQSGEGRSRAEIGFKGLQDELFRAVLEANKRVVLVLMNGRPMTIQWASEQVPALVEAWLLGSQSGHAIADVLFGDTIPRASCRFRSRTRGTATALLQPQNTGRPGPQPEVFWSRYTDVLNQPLYPFGFGLSYTSFTYSEPKLSTKEIGRDGEVRVSATVTNSGRRAGTEVVQLYVRDLVGSVTRPVRELKGFQKVELAPGEAREVTFTLKARTSPSTRRAASGRRSQATSRCSSAAARPT